MYLSDYQKLIIKKILTKGQSAIFDEIDEKFLKNDSILILNKDPSVPNKYNFGYHYIPSEPQEAYIAFAYHKPDKGPTFNYSIPADKKEFFEAKSKTESYETLEPELRSISTEFSLAELREDKRQIQQLQEIQGIMEETILLLTTLAENNIIILYEKDLLKGALSMILEKKSPQYNFKHIYIRSEGDFSSIYRTFLRFYKQEIIIIPELKNFKSRNYCTLQEWNKGRELRLLKYQTWFVVLGIIASAFVSVWSGYNTHPNTNDIQAITNSINGLTVKVDELTPNVQQNELSIPIMLDAISDQSIQTKTIL